MPLKPAFFVLILLFCTTPFFAQPSDSLPSPKRGAMFSLVQELTSSDYLAAIENAHEVINTVHNSGEISRRTMFTIGEIEDTNNDIGLITQNIQGASNTNVRNQRMYEKVLMQLLEKLEGYSTILEDNSVKIISLRKDLRTVMKDTVFRKLVRDSVLRKQYSFRLKPLREKFIATDSLLKANLSILNTHQANTSNKKMSISETLVMVNERLDRSGISMFGNECPNLWQTDRAHSKDFGAYISEKWSVEVKAFIYYFRYSLLGIIWLIIATGLLFWYIKRNLMFVAKTENTESLDLFRFDYLNRGVLLPAAVVVLNIAIAINLYAPALYIEFLHLLLLLSLAVMFQKKWSVKAFNRWLLLIGIFMAFSFIDLFLQVGLIQRCLFIAINIVAIRYGIVHLKCIKEEMFVKGFFGWANVIFISFNVMAILFNIFGRVSLAHTLSLTAVIALTQIIALSVLLKIILEIITLQIYVLRLKRGISRLFDFNSIAKNAQKPFTFIILYLWIVVIASNLNISEALQNFATAVFNRQNRIGSFDFRIGSVILFVVIVWIAHLLQNFVAFFFGEIEQEDQENINKRQHSKLLITRLMLLVFGYLLAISASGMPLDKITIVLGALGVGVGLGLQSIVANFVSGVILIFERPIQIGDVIETGSQSGRVKEIGLRTTKIDTSNGAEVIIPNGNILSQNITNWTYSNNHKLTELAFGLSGVISQDQVGGIIIAALNSISDVVPDKDPQIFFTSVGTEKLQVRVKFWCNIYRTEQALSDARITLYESFKKREIDITD